MSDGKTRKYNSWVVDGGIWITDSDKIIVPLDAEKTLMSKKVKWKKVNKTTTVVEDN